MAASSGKVTLTGVDSMARSIQEHDRKVKRVMGGIFLQGESTATTFAKNNAPWTDRTGNARSGLFSKASFGPEENFYCELLVAHSVFYGIFLEARFSGKYAIIMPTVNYMGPILMQRIASAISAMEAAA